MIEPVKPQHRQTDPELVERLRRICTEADFAGADLLTRDLLEEFPIARDAAKLACTMRLVISLYLTGAYSTALARAWYVAGIEELRGIYTRAGAPYLAAVPR